MRSPTERLELIEKHLDTLRSEVTAVRLDLSLPTAATSTVSQAEIVTRTAATTPPRHGGPITEATWQQTPSPLTSAADREPVKARRQVDLDRLFGASGLAWAGGVVTLLGIVFFFAMAIHRGWVTPEMRVLLGAVASGGLIAVAHILRGKFQSMPAALAAAGAGIAGLLAAVVASTRMYEFVADPVGLSIALAIAGGGVVLASRWDAEPIAAFGLAGAAFSAPIIAGDITAAGTWFVLVALAGSVAVAVAHRWSTPLIATTVVGLPQLIGVIGNARLEGADRGAALILAGTAWLILTGVGALWQRRSATPTVLDKLTLPALGAGLATLVFAFLALLDRDVPGVDPQAVGFLALGAVYLGSALAASRYHSDSPLLPILGALGFAMEAVGLGEVLGGPGRVLAFAAQAGVLTWLAGRLGERRLRFVALADVAIATGFALALAPPTHLFTENLAALSGALASVAVAAALGFLAWTSREDNERNALSSVSGVGALHALGMSILALVQHGQDGSPGAIQGAFQRGQMAISIILGLIGLTALVLGVQRSRTDVRIGGVTVLAISLAKLFLYDLQTLDALTRALAFFLVGGALLAGGAVLGRRSPENDEVGVSR